MFAKSFLGGVAIKRMGLCAWFEVLVLFRLGLPRDTIRLLQRDRTGIPNRWLNITWRDMQVVGLIVIVTVTDNSWRLSGTLRENFRSVATRIQQRGETKTKPQTIRIIKPQTSNKNSEPLTELMRMRGLVRTKYFTSHCILFLHLFPRNSSCGCTLLLPPLFLLRMFSCVTRIQQRGENETEPQAIRIMKQIKPPDSNKNPGPL